MSAANLVTIGVTAQNASDLPRLQEKNKVREQSVQEFLPPTHKMLEDGCQRLRQEWIDAEFLLLSQGTTLLHRL